jgi:hypothetical protein
VIPAQQLEARLKAVRARAAIRNYELRQLPHARGVWFRLRRLLVDADRVFILSPEQAREFIAQGYEPSPVGAELQPQKILLCLASDRAADLEGAREIKPGLSAEFLAATHIALVAFAQRE